MKDVEKKVKRARMVSLKQKEQRRKETKTRPSSAAPGGFTYISSYCEKRLKLEVSMKFRASMISRLIY